MKILSLLFGIACFFSTSHVVVDTAFQEEQGNNEEENSSCVVGDDGTCVLPTTTETNNSEETDEEAILAMIELPPIVKGYVDIGFGEAQQVQGSPEVQETTLSQLRRMMAYMQHKVAHDPSFKYVREECQNRNELCAYWASIGECQANPNYMQLQCAPSCRSCEHLRFETRCPMREGLLEEGVWGPGDLNAMFQRIAHDPPYANASTILAQPGMKLETYDHDPPWVIMVDDLLSPEECETLIALGSVKGYERSKDVGARKFDGTYDAKESTGRTSSNAWCTDDCYDDPVTKVVLQKLEDLTGIPDPNSEYLQLLKYEVGQRYESHHDFILHHDKRPQGVRILTVFLYLNDVPEGGGTKFNNLNITVMPKQGRALLWASVMNASPHKKDRRTHHEALPVVQGIKYGANAWFHQRDFKEPYKNNCI